nr:ankyrin repeat family protein [Tanacetum cinerariifolium]
MENNGIKGSSKHEDNYSHRSCHDYGTGRLQDPKEHFTSEPAALDYSEARQRNAMVNVAAVEKHGGGRSPLCRRNNEDVKGECAVASSSTTIGSNINTEDTISNNNDIKEGMCSTSDNNNISEDDVTLFVAYDGKWEYDNKEWFFENSKSSTMDVPKRITLSEISDNLYKQFKVDTYDRLKLQAFASLYELRAKTIDPPLNPPTVRLSVLLSLKTTERA